MNNVDILDVVRIPVQYLPIHTLITDQFSREWAAGLQPLIESIAAQGLVTPLTVVSSCKGGGDSAFLTVVSGARRLVSLWALWQNDVPVHDTRTGTTRGARQVYSWVPCRVIPR
jgi:hypothetical protein